MKALMYKTFFRLLSASLDDKGMELLDVDPYGNGYLLTVGMPDLSEKKVNMKRSECIKDIITKL